MRYKKLFKKLCAVKVRYEAAEYSFHKPIFLESSSFKSFSFVHLTLYVKRVQNGEDKLVKTVKF